MLGRHYLESGVLENVNNEFAYVFPLKKLGFMKEREKYKMVLNSKTIQWVCTKLGRPCVYLGYPKSNWQIHFLHLLVLFPRK